VKKKEVLIVSIMGIVTIAIILFGYKYSVGEKEKLLLHGAQQTEQVEVQSSVEPEVDTSEAAKTAALEQTLQVFSENRGAASVVDYLQYVNYHNKQVNVAFFGDVAEDASWAKTAMTDIQSAYALSNVSTSFFSHPEESSTAYLNGGYSKTVAASNADVIFYVLPTKADQRADISLAASTENSLKVYDEIKSSLPNVLIVLVTPPPAQDKMQDWNSRALDYTNYSNNLVDANKTYNVPLYDMHEDIIQKLKTTGASLSTIMDEAKIGLNESGVALFGEVFVNNVKTKAVNTISGLYVTGEKPAMEPIIKGDSSAESIEEVTIDSEEPIIEPVEEAVSEEPIYEEPVYQAPVYEEPYYYEETPAYVPPAYVAPVYEEPAYVAPVEPVPEPVIDTSSSAVEDSP